MPAKHALAAVIVAAAAALAACGDSGGSTAPDGDGAPPAEVTVEISDFAYGTPELTVAAGATVTFVNEDKAAHTATARAEEFNTGSIGGGESMAVTVGDSGTIAYFCSFHPFMEGEIVIE